MIRLTKPSTKLMELFTKQEQQTSYCMLRREVQELGRMVKCRYRTISAPKSEIKVQFNTLGQCLKFRLYPLNNIRWLHLPLFKFQTKKSSCYPLIKSMEKSYEHFISPLPNKSFENFVDCLTFFRFNCI